MSVYNREQRSISFSKKAWEHDHKQLADLNLISTYRTCQEH